jgi:hypothetical protein
LLLNVNDNLEYLSPNIFNLPLKRLELERLYKLDTLIIKNNIKKLTNLQYLSILESSLHSNSIDFSNIPTLKYLSVNSWNSSIPKLDSLVGLNISRKVDSTICKELAHMRFLEELMIRITDKESFLYLSQFKKLNMLYLGTKREFISQSIVNKINNLDYLYISIDTNEPIEIDATLFNNFGDIRYLNMHTGIDNQATLRKKFLEEKNVEYFKITAKLKAKKEIINIGKTRAKIIPIKH